MIERVKPCMLIGADYKPGEPAPEGYLAWHEWADAQWRAGLRQVQCAGCGLWRFPQEMSGEVVRRGYRTNAGGVIESAGPLCSTCTPPDPAPMTGGER